MLSGLFISLLLLQADPPASRLLVPDQQAIAGVKAEIDGIFKQQYQDAKSPQQLSALCRDMLNTAKDTKNEPASKYYLLDTARKVAINATDFELTEEIIETLAAEYAVDKLALLASSTRQIASAARFSDDRVVVLGDHRSGSPRGAIRHCAQHVR